MCSRRTACLVGRKVIWRVEGGDHFGGQLALDNGDDDHYGMGIYLYQQTVTRDLEDE
jgi:hypothetical protein